ncbi:MAG: hypothetical protein GY711_33385 [bacterium]|nr:hypothetical protein [bacterium]
MEAARNCHPGAVELLLEHGADPTLEENVRGHDSLQLARAAGKGAATDIARALEEIDAIDRATVEVYVQGRRRVRARRRPRGRPTHPRAARQRNVIATPSLKFESAPPNTSRNQAWKYHVSPAATAPSSGTAARSSSSWIAPSAVLSRSGPS